VAETQRLEPVDVAVVGAGFAAAAFAARLAERAPRLRILCLGRGGWVDPAAMPAATRQWQRAALGAWASSPNLRLQAGGNPFSADYPIDDSASALKPLMWNGVGGSTVNWAAHFPRLHPSDFGTRSLDGVGDDWPFGYEALEPYYDLNDRAMGVSGLAGDPAYPPKPARGQPPLALGRLGLAAARGFDRLGWHWWPVDAAINSRAHGGRPGCNHCGPCQIGCVSRAKASVDVTYWPRAIAAGVELRERCIVQQIVIEAGRATALIYRGPDGRDYRQPAGRIVVAGNGIGTARLLLASGVDSPALGRNLMYHPTAYVGGMFEHPMDGPRPPLAARSIPLYSKNPPPAGASSAASTSRSRARTRCCSRRCGWSGPGAMTCIGRCARNSTTRSRR
jgi:choline dehydrogenase-like flavoprotein